MESAHLLGSVNELGEIHKNLKDFDRVCVCVCVEERSGDCQNIRDHPLDTMNVYANIRTIWTIP